jgi:hypothetical protein
MRPIAWKKGSALLLKPAFHLFGIHAGDYNISVVFCGKNIDILPRRAMIPLSLQNRDRVWHPESTKAHSRPAAFFVRGGSLFYGWAVQGQLRLRRLPLLPVCQPCTVPPAPDWHGAGGKFKLQQRSHKMSQTNHKVASPSVSNFQLTVASTEIRQIDGLYSLNDLHKASGELQQHRQKYWLANKQTKELIAEIQKGGISPFTVRCGVDGRTYACWELVYAYAMWISAAFHFTVIRAFDALVTGERRSPPVQISDDLKTAIVAAMKESVRPEPKKTPEELIEAWFEPNGYYFAKEFLYRLALTCMAHIWQGYEYYNDKANGKPVKLSWGIPLPKKAA